MSGWGGYDWASIIFGVFLILMGLLNLLATFRRERGRIDDWRLRYGDGGADLSRAPWSERWGGAASIGFGLLALLDPRLFPRNPGFLVGMGGFALAVAFWLLLVEPVMAARRLRRHEAEIAWRARDTFAYGDELRALQANPPATGSPRLRWLSASILMLFGGSFLAIGLLGTGR